MPILRGSFGIGVPFRAFLHLGVPVCRSAPPYSAFYTLATSPAQCVFFSGLSGMPLALCCDTLVLFGSHFEVFDGTFELFGAAFGLFGVPFKLLWQPVGVVWRP